MEGRIGQHDAIDGRVYRRLNNAAAKATKAGALRAAALKLLASEAYRQPFYWAGFVVMGDGL